MSLPPTDFLPQRYIERTNGDGKTVRNRILLSIPETEFRSLRPYLQQIAFKAHRVLYEPAEKLHFAYFPNGGLVSLVVVAKDGRSVETGLFGRDGVAGLAAVMGFVRSPLRQVVQIASEGFKIAIGPFQSVLRSAPGFHTLLSHRVALQGFQTSQVAACNRLHNVVQRLARWLLMVQDRIDSRRMQITHDFLATMLGTDRPTVSLAASQLQKKRCIEYVRGGVRILSRKRLENAACECYGVLKQWNGELGLE